LVEIFIGRLGKILFTITIIIYLYGSLSVFSVTVPISVVSVTGGFSIGNAHFSADAVYYLYLLCFALVVCPLCFFNFQKTKYFQLFTMLNRTLALYTMITISIVFIAEGNGAVIKDLKWVDFGKLPALFGVSVFAFMCHHSLPGIISPIKNKNAIHLLMFIDVLAILITYVTLGATAMVAYGAETKEKCDFQPGPPCTLQKLYTLNFNSFKIVPIAYYLALYPVFALSSNFPLIAITLRNNMMGFFNFDEVRQNRFRPFFSILAFGPPLCIAASTKDAHFLVDITGSYAGVFIMFVFPALIVFFARRKIAIMFPGAVNQHQSPFSFPKPNFWVFLGLGFSGVALILVVVRQMMQLFGK